MIDLTWKQLRRNGAGWTLLLAAGVALAAMALLRKPNHDESQYVAAAVLTGAGMLPYRDFAWLQTPLQPFVFAPFAQLLGVFAWPGLRLANAALGLLALVGVYRAARTGNGRGDLALVATGAFFACDSFLFGAATARNDMLPLALFAWGLVAALRLASGEGSRIDAMLAGLLLAAATAAKISYAVPAIAFGAWSLLAPRRRQLGWTMLGTVPVVALMLAVAWIAPQSFWFGAITFPLDAPSDFYARQPEQLTLTEKALDLVRFLAIGAGPALLMTWRPARTDAERLLDMLILAGIVVGAMPTPVWRQYLIPLLAPLAVRAALTWRTRQPGRFARTAIAGFAVAGLVPSAMTSWNFPAAWREGNALDAELDAIGVSGPLVTLAPHLTAATGRPPDPRFAAGPFMYRSHSLVKPGEERELNAAVHRRFVPLAPNAVVLGSDDWHPVDAPLERALLLAARRQGYRAYPIVDGAFTLLLPPATLPKRRCRADCDVSAPRGGGR